MNKIENDNDDAIRADKFKKLVVDLNEKNMALYKKEHNAPVPTAGEDRSYHERSDNHGYRKYSTDYEAR